MLRRSSDDLNVAVSQLAELNTTDATRDQELGALFDDQSSVMTTLAEEGQIVKSGRGWHVKSKETD